MIASLRGQVTDLGDDYAVIEVGGVGLQVYIPAAHHDELTVGEGARLFTHLIVRETELTLYGFPGKEERQFFGLLLGVKGVGPKLALAVLSTLTPNAIRRAVFNEQADVFGRVSGVGKKTAQQILLHLEGKLTDVEGLEPVAAMDDADTEVLEALTALGYSVVEAQAALQNLPKDAPDNVEERLRMALAYFSS